MTQMEYSCICGACKVTSSEDPLSVYCCHCFDCQRTSGTDYQLNARFEPKQLRVEAPKDGLARFRKEGSLAERVYCRTCHVRVFVDRWDDNGALMLQVVPVGLVTGGKGDPQDPRWRPTDHAFYGERARDVYDDLSKWSQRKGSEQLHPPPPGPSKAASVSQAVPPLRLSCHCGATTAECTEGPLFTYYCHCSSCQQLPGSAFCHNAQFSPDQPKMLSGEKELVWYQKPGSRIRTTRCGTCFTRLFREMEGEDGKLVKRVLPVGVVVRASANDPAWHPRYHIWWSERSIPSLPDGLPKWSRARDTSELCK